MDSAWKMRNRPWREKQRFDDDLALMWWELREIQQMTPGSARYAA
jgi:hypothetical protein